MLFYLDSNQDKQDQNLLCCHYTIEQWSLFFDDTKVVFFFISTKQKYFFSDFF